MIIFNHEIANAAYISGSFTSSFIERAKLTESLVGMTQNDFNIFIGNGLTSSPNDLKGVLVNFLGRQYIRNLSSHNSIVEIVYRTGILGMAFISTIIVSICTINIPKVFYIQAKDLMNLSLILLSLSLIVNSYNIAFGEMWSAALLFIIALKGLIMKTCGSSVKQVSVNFQY